MQGEQKKLLLKEGLRTINLKRLYAKNIYQRVSYARIADT